MTCLEAPLGLKIRVKLAYLRILSAQLQKTAATEGLCVVAEALDGLIPDGLGILLDGLDEGRQNLGPLTRALLLPFLFALLPLGFVHLAFATLGLAPHR